MNMPSKQKIQDFTKKRMYLGEKQHFSLSLSVIFLPFSLFLLSISLFLVICHANMRPTALPDRRPGASVDAPDAPSRTSMLTASQRSLTEVKGPSRGVQRPMMGFKGQPERSEGQPEGSESHPEESDG